MAKIYRKEGAIILEGIYSLTDKFSINPTQFDWNVANGVYFVRDGIENRTYELGTVGTIEKESGTAYATATELEQTLSTFSILDTYTQDLISPTLIVKASNIIAETTTTGTHAIDDNIINVADATGFLVGQYLTIYNEVANRVYFANILSINALAITVDTPLDFAFPAGSFVSVGNTNLNVNGATEAQKFGIRNPQGVDIPLSFHITRLMFKCLTNTSIDLSKFGDIAGGLTKGLVIRKKDGVYYNIFNAKTNSDLKLLMYDLDIQQASGSQQDGFTGRMTFAGANKVGVAISLAEDEDLEIIIQDNLSTLVKFEIVAEGHVSNFTT